MISRILRTFLGIILIGILVIYLIHSFNISNSSQLQVNVSIYSELFKFLNKSSSAASKQENSPKVIIKKNGEKKQTFDEVNEKTSNTPVTKEQRQNKKTPSTLPLCSEKGENLVGSLFIDQSVPKDMAEIESTLSVANGGAVEKGGWWSPINCKPRHKVAIVIPYRKRINQLKVFLKHMHPFLQRQLIHYRIFVVEQLYDDPFNRGGLFNIGFSEALKRDEFDCFIFTDVDLLPEDDRNSYSCPTSPRHMSVAVDSFHYRLPYATIFGGVGAFTKDNFEEMNGFSNLFFGWGGEDDDLYKRVKSMGWEISRPSQQIGRYTMLSVGHHRSSQQGANTDYLLSTSEQRRVADGLNTLKYNVKRVLLKRLFTVLKVAIIVPYRNRFEQLKMFLRHMHNILQRQQLYYRIIVVEQLEKDPFNRAGLFNVGYVEAIKYTDFDCFVFSDIDLLPENDRNYYGCPTSPRHMSVAVDKFNYKLPYATIFGGVGAFKRKDFEKVNGFSNLFWGWGGEDDDLYGRIMACGFKLTRPSLKIGRYTMIRKHHVQSSQANPNRGNLLRDTRKRMNVDGINTVKYKLVKLDEEPLVTFVRVEMKQSMYV